MRAAAKTLDVAGQKRLITTFAETDYVERYLKLCNDFEVDRDLGGPRLNLAQTVELFRDAGVEAHLDKRFKMVTFDLQEAAGWAWQGKLVVQKYDMLEPMFEGATPQHVVGSTMFGLALDAADQRTPPIQRERFLAPHPNRPRFDGDMRTMARLVSELVALTQWMRQVIAVNWTDRPTQTGLETP